MRRALPLVTALLLATGPSWADGFYDGISAYNSGDYGAALRHWRPLAEKGDAKAQSGLGFLHHKGLGLTQNSAEAARWFYLAAVQGRVEAQTFLGIMHFRGDGVARNPVLAHMWCDLAVGAGYEQALDCREAASRRLTQSQIEESQRLVIEFRGLRQSN